VTRSLAFGAAALFAILVVAYSFSIDLRATRGASITGDEPFYLLTTQSLLQDGDLDLRQQYESESYRSFFDHPDGLWTQSVALPDGRLLSPHDPGLSVLLLPGFAIGGLRGAQIELMVIAALTFALAYVLVAADTGARILSWVVTLAVALTATAFVYSTEIYPEVPAALIVVAALLLLSRSPHGTWSAFALVALLTALAWLGVKYLPLGGLIALFFLARATARARWSFVGLAALSAVGYVSVHLAVFGDLTAYSVNYVYDGTPTVDILRAHIGLEERAYRIYGLFIDRNFGIGRWAPLLLFVPLALPLLLLRGRIAVLAGLLVVTQLLIATFVAITMMGWWFPGRTLATVFPLLPLALVVLIVRWPRLRIVAAAAAAYSVAITLALVVGARQGEVVLAVDPFALDSPLLRAPAALFPSYTAWGADTIVLTVGWIAAAAVAFVAMTRSGAALRSAGRLP
jgi:hypothetical protein